MMRTTLKPSDQQSVQTNIVSRDNPVDVNMCIVTHILSSKAENVIVCLSVRPSYLSCLCLFVRL